MLLPFGKTKKPDCKDEDIYTGLRLGSGPAFERAVKCLYKSCGEKVLRDLSRMGASSADAEDVFQDSIIVLLRIFRDRDVVLTVTICSYLSGIAHNILRNKWRGRPDKVEWKDMDEADTPEEILAEEEAATFLRHHLTAECITLLSEKCQNIIEDFLAGMPMEEIAVKHGYKDAHSARQTKLRCINQLKKYVHERWKAAGY